MKHRAQLKLLSIAIAVALGNAAFAQTPPAEEKKDEAKPAQNTAANSATKAVEQKLKQSL
jgi:hypothetical protein